MEILNNFGIQPVLLAAQIVNFLIILFLLKKFFYKPIIKILDERKKKIEESLKNADLIAEQLQKTRGESAQVLEEATKGAQTIISNARQEAERIAANANFEAKQTMEEIIFKAKVQIDQQKQQMQKELEKATINLVIDVVNKILSRTLKTRQRQILTSKAVAEISKQIR